MITIKALFISAFIFLKISGSIESTYGVECDQITTMVTVTVEEGKGSKVEIEVKGGIAPYKYLFYKASGNLVSEDFNSRSVSQLAPGKYYCTVADKKGCRKTIEFEIK